jgi:hypothetical protein
MNGGTCLAKTDIVEIVGGTYGLGPDLSRAHTTRVTNVHVMLEYKEIYT